MQICRNNIDSWVLSETNRKKNDALEIFKTFLISHRHQQERKNDVLLFKAVSLEKEKLIGSWGFRIIVFQYSHITWNDRYCKQVRRLSQHLPRSWISKKLNSLLGTWMHEMEWTLGRQLRIHFKDAANLFITKKPYFIDSIS